MKLTTKNKAAIQILHDVCSTPTAPGCEGLVIRLVEAFVAARRTLLLTRDRFGNLMIEFRRHVRSRKPRWVFEAHMDHPGFVAGKMIDGRTLEAEFRGMVYLDYFAGTRVRFFDGEQQITGRVMTADADPDHPTRAGRLAIRVSGPVATGSPGMFDQGESRLKGDRFHCRAIDDVGGVASLLAMLDELHRTPPTVPVAVMLTRCEEAGFVGAIAAAKYPQLLRKTDRIIVIETSAMQSYAPQGAGPIIRIGDKTSIFNSAISYFLTEQAKALAKMDPSFKFQRALMPGGTCEASVYDVFGYQAGAICVALGNYHNMDGTRKKIAPEHIHIGDWLAMVRLFVHVAGNAHDFEPFGSFKRYMDKQFSEIRKWLI